MRRPSGRRRISEGFRDNGDKTTGEERSHLPGLVLLFLSPMIAERLSGSAPPAESFNPPGFVLLTVLYGGSALLARELMHHWGKGWLTLLALAAAYGIAEEGLMCKSVFDPNWEDVGILGIGGRWGSVNWRSPD